MRTVYEIPELRFPSNERIWRSLRVAELKSKNTKLREQRLLNPGGVPEFEACATVGKGVCETRKGVAKGVLSDLKKLR